MGRYRKILVAVDGSESSKNAFRQACRVSRQDKSWITVITTIPLYQDQFQTLSIKEKASKALKAEGEKILADIKKIADEEDVFIRLLLKEGNAVDTILDVEEENNFELIVMGRHGKSRLERALVGSVASHVIGHSRKDILVVPENTAIRWDTILTATDGSKQSSTALKKAIELSKLYNSKLKAVSVVDVTDEFMAEAPEAVEGLINKANKYLMDLKKKAEARGVDTEIFVREGETYKVITELSGKLNAGVIVTGSRSRTGVKRLFMGSVTEKVIGYAPCPVLVVKV